MSLVAADSGGNPRWRDFVAQPDFETRAAALPGGSRKRAGPGQGRGGDPPGFGNQPAPSGHSRMEHRPSDFRGDPGGTAREKKFRGP